MLRRNEQKLTSVYGACLGDPPVEALMCGRRGKEQNAERFGGCQSVRHIAHRWPFESIEIQPLAPRLSVEKVNGSLGDPVEIAAQFH